MQEVVKEMQVVSESRRRKKHLQRLEKLIFFKGRHLEALNQSK